MNGTITLPCCSRQRPVPRSPRVPDSPPAPAGALYLVSTPIGNIEDITLRALRTLKEVTLIAAEDTRRTARLLSHYGIHTSTTSFHEHNEVRKGPHLLRRLAAGDSVALVSDAGTPLLSDPGARLVRDALAAGVNVHAVPGPSAALAGLVMSGLGGGAFTVVGFPPSRSNDRKRWLAALETEPRPFVLFEAPHRIGAALTDMATVLGDRDVAVCREMTKAHEELVTGPISEVMKRLPAPRGEYTIVVGAPVPRPEDRCGTVDQDRLWHEFCHLTENLGCDRRVAIRILADRHALGSRSIYSLLEARKENRSLDRSRPPAGVP